MYISLVHKPFSLWETFHPSESTIFKVRLWHEETMIRSRCWVDFPWGITHYRYLFLIKFPHSFYYSYLFPGFHQATKALIRRKRNLNKHKKHQYGYILVNYIDMFINICVDKKEPYCCILSAMILLRFSLIFSLFKTKLFWTFWGMYLLLQSQIFS